MVSVAFKYVPPKNSPKKQQRPFPSLLSLSFFYAIEEVWRKKPRQTDVVVLWGKIATHTLLVADKLIKGGQGQKYGGIFVYYIFYNRWIDFPSNVLRHSGKYCIPIVLY